MKAREALVEVMTDLTSTFGEAAATQAMEIFMSMREDAGITSAYAPVLAPPPTEAQVDSSVRWAVGTLFGEKFDREATLSKLEGIATRMILQQSRETIAKNVSRRGSGSYAFARVLGPGESCDWCLMLSSRGPVYRSYDSAKGDGDGFHDNCRCMAVPFFEGTEVDGYDPEALYADYKKRK